MNKLALATLSTHEKDGIRYQVVENTFEENEFSRPEDAKLSAQIEAQRQWPRNVTHIAVVELPAHFAEPATILAKYQTIYGQ